MTTRIHIAFGCHDTRRNLPSATAAKQGESNFLARFESVYLPIHSSTLSLDSVATGREFALEGFGRADLLFITWRTADENFTARTIRDLRITAFEAKLKDWRKGLVQASRYRHFANRSLLVLPPSTALIALPFVQTFRALNVGLWEFDSSTARLRRHFTPRQGRALNSKARAKAAKMISTHLAQPMLLADETSIGQEQRTNSERLS